MRRSAFLIAFVGLTLSGCFDDPVAGGTVETENTVAARTISVDSLLSPWNRPVHSPTVATLRLDTSNIPFDKMSASGQDLSVERMDGSPIPFRVVVWDKAAFLGRIQVHLDSSLQRQDSKFKLRWGLKDSLRTDSQAVWSGITDSQRILLSSVLVDDFEGTNLKSPLPNTAWWYSSSSDSATVSSPQLVRAGPDQTGGALQITYKALSAKSQYALVGLAIDPGPRSLRTLDSLVFWARGSGKLTLALEHLSTSGTRKALVQRGIDSNWTRISIRPQDLEPAAIGGEGGNVGWNAVRDSVTNLSYFVSDGAALWLDDVRFYGIDRDDLK
jgi:hypothetical protein